jgi:4-hydroxy-2-oxoheptanedioate aldolase
VQNPFITLNGNAMRANTLKDKLANGQSTTCGWAAIPSTFSAELSGHAGFDTVVVDLQHGMIDFHSALPMLQALSGTPAIPMVRSSWNNVAEIMHLLDAGAYGVICPMISTAAQCETFVRACRYPPHGDRSFGPARGLLYGGADYFAHADSHVLTWAMIETQEGLDNLDAILTVKGLDGIFIGPNDFALALGCKPGTDFTARCGKIHWHLHGKWRARRAANRARLSDGHFRQRLWHAHRRAQSARRQGSGRRGNAGQQNGLLINATSRALTLLRAARIVLAYADAI